MAEKQKQSQTNKKEIKYMKSLMRVMGTKQGSSERAIGALNC